VIYIAATSACKNEDALVAEWKQWVIVDSQHIQPAWR